MAVWRSVYLDIKEAELLADLAGVHDDLETIVAICDMLLKGVEIKDKPIDYTAYEALMSAALVRYARIYSKGGVRERRIPKGMILSLSPELLKKHEWFIEFRNKHIVRSINAYEDNRVVATLVPEERGPKAIADISVERRRLASLGNDKIDDLKTLCQELLRHIDDLYEKEKIRVLEAAKKLPIEELYCQKQAVRPLPKDTDVKKPRKAK
ncbi:MAG: hypothetical protein WC581_10645 [Thermodesulfovibrionales bacterium]